MLKYIYEFRYFLMLPYDEKNYLGQTKEMEKEVEELTKEVLEKAHQMKVIERFSKQKEIDYMLLKHIFQTRNINLEEIEIKLGKEKDKYSIQVFEENGMEEKIEIPNPEIINKKDLAIRFNKKVKVFY